MKVVLLISLLYLTVRFCMVCSAEEYYFDFMPQSFLGSFDNELEVDIRYDLDSYVPNDFRIKTKSDIGIVEIYNSNGGKWLSEYEEWSKLPDLSEKVIVRAKEPPQKGVVYLSFVIQNKLTGELYETPSKQIFFLNTYKNYIGKLNGRLTFADSSSDVESIRDSGEYFPDKNTQFNNKYKNLMYVSSGAVILFSLLLLGIKLVRRGKIKK